MPLRPPAPALTRAHFLCASLIKAGRSLFIRQRMPMLIPTSPLRPSIGGSKTKHKSPAPSPPPTGGFSFALETEAEASCGVCAAHVLNQETSVKPRFLLFKPRVCELQFHAGSLLGCVIGLRFNRVGRHAICASSRHDFRFSPVASNGVIYRPLADPALPLNATRY